MELKIHRQDGTLKAAISPDANSTQQCALMGDNVLNLSFTLPDYMALEVNDYVDFRGERYTLLFAYEPVQKSTLEYQYSPKFYGIESILRKTLMLHSTDGQLSPVFSLDDSPAAHLNLVIANINRVDPHKTWRMGGVITAPNQDIEYQNLSCFEALAKIVEAFGTEWWMDGDTINLIKCERGDRIELGYGNGLLNLSKNENSSDVRFITRLLPLGSTRNINKEKYGFPRLQLPDRATFVERNTHYGISEAVEESAFAHIYPKRIGKVGTVRTEEREDEGKKFTVYYFTDPGMSFNPNDYEIAGLVKHVVFQSGELNGRDFEVNFNSDTKEYEIINQYPTENRQLPGGNLVPKKDNEYILYNITMPSEYYAPAEQEFKTAVDALLDKYSIDTAVYKGDTDYIHFDREGLDIDLGQNVRLLSTQYFKEEGYRDNRVVSFTRNINNPGQISIECSNEIGKGRAERMEGDINSIKAIFANQQDEKALSILRSWDTIPETDFNIYSAKRTLKEVTRRALSRLEDDEAQGTITFLRGLFSDNVRSEDFTSGALGSGFVVKSDPNTGKSYMEVDELFVRMKAIFSELEIKKLSHAGGDYVFSAAGMKCAKVEEFDDFWRCSFIADDGKTAIDNPFRLNDQVSYREFNVKPGIHENISNRYYWRLVTGVGDDYIDLSKTDCDSNSDTPLAGDSLVQIGNRTDKSRQNAIVVSVYGDDAPSIHQYADIHSYSMSGKEVTVISPKGNKFIGDFILKTGVDVLTKFAVMENLFRSEMESLRNEIQEKDNYLSNSAFASSTDKWVTTNDIRFFTVNDRFLYFNNNFYSEKKQVADLIDIGSRKVLRIKASGIKQVNADLKDNPEKDSSFFVSFRIRVLDKGTLTVGFPGQGLYHTETFEPTEEFIPKEYSGTWNGMGDFELQFTGDAYLYSLAITDDAFNDMVTVFKSRFEQTDKKIEGVVTSINNLEEKSSGWLTEADGTKIWASCQFPNGTKALSLFDITPEGIFLSGSHINLRGKVTFESFSPDFQTAYNQAFSNTSMTAKDDVARQLGFTNYNQLVANAAVNGKSILIGGYLNTQLIDVDTLVSDVVLARKISTVTIETNKLIAKKGSRIGGLYITEQGGLCGASNTFEKITNLFDPQSFPNENTYKNAVINRIGYCSSFMLAVNATAGTFNIDLPNYDDLRSKAFSSDESFGSGYGFSVRFIVPPVVPFPGEVQVPNNTRFKICSKDGAQILNNNGGNVAYYEMEKGDVLELYGTVKSIGFTQSIEYYTKIYKT